MCVWGGVLLHGLLPKKKGGRKVGRSPRTPRTLPPPEGGAQVAMSQSKHMKESPVMLHPPTPTLTQ